MSVCCASTGWKNDGQPVPLSNLAPLAKYLSLFDDQLDRLRIDVEEWKTEKEYLDNMELLNQILPSNYL